MLSLNLYTCLQEENMSSDIRHQTRIRAGRMLTIIARLFHAAALESSSQIYQQRTAPDDSVAIRAAGATNGQESEVRILVLEGLTYLRGAYEAIFLVLSYCITTNVVYRPQKRSCLEELRGRDEGARQT